MSVAHVMKGARLEFVLKPFGGSRKREKTSYDKKTKRLVKTTVKEEGGYLLYTPSGHAYYLTKEEALSRGFLNRQPKILNFDQVNDPETAAGRFKFARNDEMRRKAMHEMEMEVIKLCTSRGGRIIPGDQFEADMAQTKQELEELDNVA